MGTAALTGRLSLRARGAAAATDVARDPLAFDVLGGPLVVLCGLVGGAGTSTLAYLLARRAARHSSVPVLLGELYDHGALAALTGGGGHYGLAGLAAAIAQERPIQAPFTELPGGLRLVARSQPTFQEPEETVELERVTAHARAAHGLVVIDAGAVSASASRRLLCEANHVLYVLPATPPALRRAELLADSGALTSLPAARTAMVAADPGRGRSATVRQLRQLAERHAERLMLVPYVGALTSGDLLRGEAELEDTFSALATLLRRPE